MDAARKLAGQGVGRLAYLCKAGLSTAEALHAAAGCGGPTASALQRTRALVDRGTTLERALARSFPALAQHELAIVRAGERSGSLAQALCVLDEQIGRSLSERRRMASALAYPGFLIASALAVLCVISVVVLPTTTSLYTNSGTPVPLSTTVLIRFGQLVVRYGPALVGCGTLLLFALALARSRSQSTREFLDASLLHVPVMSSLVRNATRASAYRILAATLEAGTDMHDALGLTASTIENRAMRRRFERVGERVLKGIRPAAAIADSGIDPSGLDAGMLHAAEAGGNYAEMLKRLSMVAGDEYEQALAAIARGAEPIAVVTMAVAVGFGALGLYQPILGSSAILAAG